MSIGKRIKEERERLEYSQTVFAELVGASKGAQIGWEKGTTFPNASVLAAWAEKGLDVAYVLTGETTSKELDDMTKKYQATRGVLSKIQYFLRIEKYDLLLTHALEMACNDVSTMWNDDGETNKAFGAVRDLLNKSPVLMLDQLTLEDVIERIEFALEIRKATLSPANKARAILYLFEAVKSSGARPGLRMVDDAIQNATR